MDHIEGKAAMDRTHHASDDDEPGFKDRSRTRSKGHISHKASNKIDQDEAYNDAKSNYSKEDVRSKGATSDKFTKSVTSGINMSITQTNFKFDLPDSCFISMMKGVKIEKLDSKFYLVSHPYPQVEGEMLVFQPKKDDQSEEDLIVYRDYSLRKRIPTEEKKASALSKKKQTKEADVEAKLQCLEIDNDNPLSVIEWRNTATVLKEIRGLAWFQVLPTGQKCSQPLQFNIIHILPEFKYPVEKLPI